MIGKKTLKADSIYCCIGIENRIDTIEDKQAVFMQEIDKKIEENHIKTINSFNSLKYGIEFIQECNEKREREQREHYLVQIENIKGKQRITEKLYKISTVANFLLIILATVLLLLILSFVVKYGVLLNDYSNLSSQFDEMSNNYTIITNELESILNNKDTVITDSN